jgi:hypothetical protein
MQVGSRCYSKLALLELSNSEMAWQKLDYLHFNLVEAGFTSELEEYLYSSARDYVGKKGLLEIKFS